jgi:hypothetical protein
MNNAKTTDSIGASVTRGGSQDESMSVLGHYTVECVGSDGQVKWNEDFDNLVTTQGKDHLLNNGLAGPATAVAVRMSFITSGTPVVGDTYASHAGFTELGSGIIAARGTPAFSASSAGVKSTSSAVSASVIGTGTVTGVAINLVVGAVGNLGVVADTATSGGILYSAGLFGSSKSVSSGDTLNVTYSTTLT